MKCSIMPLAALLSFAGSLAAQSVDVRKWSGRQGSATFEGFIVDVDEAGNALLQEYKPRKVPIASLSDKDQAYVKEWRERTKKDREALVAAKLSQAFNTPVLAPLAGNLKKMEGKELKDYTPAEPEKIEVIAFVFTQGKVDKSPYVSRVSELYERERRDNPAFEAVFISLDETEVEMKQFLIDKKVKIPVWDFAISRQLNRTAIGKLYGGNVVPQVTVVDRAGNVITRSFSERPTEGDLMASLKELEKAIRKAKRANGPASSATPANPTATPGKPAKP